MSTRLTCDENMCWVFSHFRYSQGSLVLWAAVLCIDQRNNEKDPEVRLMNRIYSYYEWIQGGR